MSPEQCQGNILDQRSDLYGLGCMIYEGLTAQKAVPGKTAFEAMSNQIGRMPEPMSQACPEANIPEEAERLIFQLLSKDPSDRFDNAREFATQFRSAIEFARSQPVSASSASSRSITRTTLLEPGSAGNTSAGRNAITSGNSGSGASQSLRAQNSGASTAGKSGTHVAPNTASTSTSGAGASMSGRNVKLTAAAAQSMQANKPNGFLTQLKNPITMTLICAGVLASAGLIFLLSGMVDTATKPPPTVKETDNNLTDVSKISNSSTARLLANNDHALMQVVYNQPDLKQLDLSRKRYTAQGLQALARATSLGQLKMRECTDVDDKALEVLQHLNIYALDLSGTKVTCGGLKYLSLMPKLRSLDLSSTQISDGGCQVLGTMPLVILNISSTGVTGEGLANLSASKTLQQLFLDDTNIGTDIKNVNPLPLIWLSVKHTKFGDKELASLTLPKLEQITLNDTQVSDAGLLSLADRKALKTVWVQGCSNIK